MAVVKIKAGGKSGEKAQIVRAASSAATKILSTDADRVLVVYEATDASIYYEADAALADAPKAAKAS
jgi:hypothetical protein